MIKPAILSLYKLFKFICISWSNAHRLLVGTALNMQHPLCLSAVLIAKLAAFLAPESYSIDDGLKAGFFVVVDYVYFRLRVASATVWADNCVGSFIGWLCAKGSHNKKKKPESLPS